MKNVLKFIAATFAASGITGAGVGGAAALEQGCTPAAVPIVVQDVPVDVIIDVGCWVADILQGTQSLAQMAAQCGALTASQIASLLTDLEQGGGIVSIDAGVDAAHATAATPAWHVPVITLTPLQVARVASLRSELPTYDAGVK